MSPPMRRSGPPPRKAAPSDTTNWSESIRSKRASAWSLRPRMACGVCTDSCRCEWKANPSSRRVEAYADAVHHLHSHGLGAAPLVPELRVLWRRSADDRKLVQSITEQWVVA